MMILNMTIAKLIQSHLLANEYFNDRAELIKYILPWGDVYSQNPQIFDIALRDEKFVNDYYKYSCDYSCDEIDKCVEEYPVLAQLSGQANAKSFHLYNPIACEIGRTYDSCAKNGYYDYSSDGSTQRWSTIVKEEAYGKIFDLVTRMPLTYNALLESCVNKGICGSAVKNDPLFNQFTHDLPKDNSIAKVLGDAVCDPSCIPVPCTENPAAACLPDKCRTERDDWNFIAIHNPYVCKVTKAWLDCAKSPESSGDGLNVGGIIGLVVGILAFIAIIVVVTYFVMVKCRKDEKTNEEP